MEVTEPMTGVDRAWLLMEQPTNPMVIIGLIVVEAKVDYEELCKLVSQRFLAFDRFRCRPAADIFDGRWIHPAHFDITDHVLRAGLPGNAGQQELEQLVGELASTPLCAQRPLWSFHLVDNYQGGSAIIMRVHHCYADGIALVRVLLCLTDRDANQRPPDAPDAEHASLVDSLWKGLGEAADLAERGVHYALHPAEAAGVAGALAHIALQPDDPPTCLKGPHTGVRRVAWGKPFPLDEVRTIGRVLGCTINDVLVATLAGALGRYLESRGNERSGIVIRAAVPVNLRPAQDTSIPLGNYFGLVFLELPVGIRHPLERLYAVHAGMQQLKGSQQALVTFGLLAVLGSLPAALLAPAMAQFSAKASLVASNVPGPQQQLNFAGAPISQLLFWVPQAGDIGVGVSLLTYNGEVQFGVIADRALIPEPRELLRTMGTEFEKLVLLVLLGGSTLSD